MPTSLWTRFLADVLVHVVVVSRVPCHGHGSSAQEGAYMSWVSADVVAVCDAGTVIRVDHHVVTGCSRGVWRSVNK